MAAPLFDEPARQKVWAVLRAINDAWTQGNPDALAEYFHPDMVAVTPTDRHRLNGRKACIAAWKSFARATTIHHWREIDPVIHIHGDAAVVAYDFDIAFDMAGKSHRLTGRDLYFFVQEKGRWWAVADQFSPYP